MDKLHHLWNFIVRNWQGIALAVVVGVIVDLLAIGSRLRAGIRRIKNKLAERSVTRLQKRIKQLETQRDTYAKYLSSDKALYLATFSIVIGILTLMALGAGITVLAEVLPTLPPLGLLALFCYLMAVGVGIAGFRISTLDSRGKISEIITKLDAEVVGLREKLNVITK
jgi:hypothetical protein